MVKIVAIQGFDSKLCESIVKGLGIPRLVTCTTRKAYRDEIDGEHYHFLPKPEFQQLLLNGRFAEVTDLNGDMYGLPLSIERLTKTTCVFIDPSCVNYLRNRFEEDCLILGISITWDYMLRWIQDNGTNGVSVYKYKRAYLERLESLNYCDIVLNVSDHNSKQVSKIVSKIGKLLL